VIVSGGGEELVAEYTGKRRIKESGRTSSPTHPRGERKAKEKRGERSSLTQRKGPKVTANKETAPAGLGLGERRTRNSDPGSKFGEKNPGERGN